jgi:cystathionine beta-lyase
MKYDFTTVMDRRGKDAIAVDAVGLPDFSIPAPRPGFDPIPMWVADMNFPVVPTVTQALRDRADHPAFGYFMPTDAYYNAIIRWHTLRNGVQGLEPCHIGYENGVLGGVMSAMAALCTPGDAVLLHSPTYIGFTGCLSNFGYRIVHSPLVQDENGVWRIDF